MAKSAPRNCLACVHCEWRGGEDTGYCSSCAGHQSAQFVCVKGHWGSVQASSWRGGAGDDAKASLGECLDMAQECADYEAEAWAPKGGA